MSRLSGRERELVALGAAMGSNCVPCMEYHIPQAKKAGLTDAQISEAIRLADRVRQVPARKVLDVALQLLTTNPSAIDAGQNETVETEQTITAAKSCCSQSAA